MAREVRISPDGNMVAIRSDNPEDSWNAWGVMNAINGGHWSSTAELVLWSTVATVTPPPSDAVPLPPSGIPVTPPSE